MGGCVDRGMTEEEGEKVKVNLLRENLKPAAAPKQTDTSSFHYFFHVCWVRPLSQLFYSVPLSCGSARRASPGLEPSTRHVTAGTG